MTVVDVNTGKFTGSGGNLEETVTKNNLEAAEEIVRQLRLRDIGGIIVIDFIDMVLESNRDLVLRRLVECLGRDRTKHQVAEVTSLGLVQMTRKRIGTGLLEAFSENCDHCGGRGLILHDEPKESRRRDSRNGQDNNKPAAQAEEPRKSSRRRGRGKGRAEDEHDRGRRRSTTATPPTASPRSLPPPPRRTRSTGTGEVHGRSRYAGADRLPGVRQRRRAGQPGGNRLPGGRRHGHDQSPPTRQSPPRRRRTGPPSPAARGGGAAAAAGARAPRRRWRAAGEGDAGSPGADAPELVTTSS